MRSTTEPKVKDLKERVNVSPNKEVYNLLVPYSTFSLSRVWEPPNPL